MVKDHHTHFLEMYNVCDDLMCVMTFYHAKLIPTNSGLELLLWTPFFQCNMVGKETYVCQAFYWPQNYVSAVLEFTAIA